MSAGSTRATPRGRRRTFGPASRRFVVARARRGPACRTSGGRRGGRRARRGRRTRGRACVEIKSSTRLQYVRN
ncbi:hypothetical protein SO694_0001501 [Aureococcus anophagefferens]|uniref:Uncharacterized protein n=1 Tax=Aureococcus anophagefferens TaxID=44056 RepID=A0ABR1G359_AURAN